jgi:hypothetical protein
MSGHVISQTFVVDITNKILETMLCNQGSAELASGATKKSLKPGLTSVSK